MKRLIVVASLMVGSVFAQSPSIYSGDGKWKYLGRLSSNPYDRDSISNPYGKYGNPYSSDSVNNEYGRYGSPYSNYSATNPYATSAPILVAPSYGSSYGSYGSYNRTVPSIPSIPSIPQLPQLPGLCCTDWR